MTNLEISTLEKELQLVAAPLDIEIEKLQAELNDIGCALLSKRKQLENGYPYAIEEEDELGDEEEEIMLDARCAIVLGLFASKLKC